MIMYDHLPLSEGVMRALSELKIEYVFQPIYYPDKKTIFAREALMRPKDCTVLELIEEYTKSKRLHILEVATLFGAMQAYELRGYSEKISVNSFPCESMNDDELRIFEEYYGDSTRKIVVEMLEYPYFSLTEWVRKNDSVKLRNNLISLDDYGTGINDLDKVNILDPHIVKIDRSLLSNIDQDVYKQANCKEIIDMLHGMNKLVVAEGVETKEEFEYLAELGADLFQGYYLGRPA